VQAIGYILILMFIICYLCLFIEHKQIKISKRKLNLIKLENKDYCSDSVAPILKEWQPPTFFGDWSAVRY